MTTHAAATTSPSLSRATPAHAGVTLRWSAHRAGGAPDAVELTIRIRDGAWTAAASVNARSLRLPAVNPDAAAWIRTRDGLEHADAPGVAAITLRRRTSGAIDVLYARSCLPELLGLPGGRCELVGAEADDNHAPE